MLMAASLLAVPLALSGGPDTTPPPSYNQVRAYVTGYNTVPGQTDDTPCTAASGADICGRRDAVACPRRIGFGTVVEIRGATYVCEDRLAPKFDTRFDISCDKDTACPPTVTGWATINVYGPIAAAAATVTAAVWHGSAVRQAVARRFWWAHPIRAAVWRTEVREPAPVRFLRFTGHAWNSGNSRAGTWRG